MKRRALAAMLAALLRPVANALGGTFQYFGWFTLTSFALQGGFGALLCGLFCESVLACAAGSLLFSASPILIERAFRHTSGALTAFVTQKGNPIAFSR